MPIEGIAISLFRIGNNELSTAAYRFLTPNAMDFDVQVQQGVMLRYNGTFARWQFIT